MIRRALALLLLATATGAQTPPTAPPLDAAAWREDLRALAVELPRRHKNAYAHMTPAAWSGAVARLDARIPELQRHEIIVELMRLVAMVGDGHTTLAPDADERTGFGRFPVELYDFSDGLFIVAADSMHRDLLGTRVVRIGSATAAAALDSAAHLVSHESPQWARLRGSSFLVMPQVLAALGITKNPQHATFVVEHDGRQRSVTLDASRDAAAVVALGTALPPGWRDMRQSAPGGDPLWLQRPGVTYWFTALPDHTLYICYRGVQFFANGETNEMFFRRAFAAGDSAHVERVVLDMRTNGGGNNFLNRFLVREILRRPALDRPDRLFVLIGRNVFSAAQNLVNELDYYTGAAFVGEPTGNSPNQYGDARPFELPRSRLRVFISSQYWQGHSAADERTSFPPSAFVELSSSDYGAKRDPVLATALRRATEPTLGARLLADAERGDSSAVRRAIAAYRDQSENRYRDIEAEVNAAGYEMLRTGKGEAAVITFRVNAALFPRSGNVYDSLGDALERTGKRDAAIAAYRQALALNGNLFTSRDGLRRLGTTP
jgi:hypothetical protein